MAVLSEKNLPKRVLLHSCCAPCSAAILEWLHNHDVSTTIFFYNPNIFPLKEYEIRKEEIKKYAKQLSIPFIEGDYDHLKWRYAVRGLEQEPERGLRCEVCFTHRLLASALCAKELGITHYTTTLAGSRWKRQEQIETAAAIVKNSVPDIEYWNQNWRKGGLQVRRGELLKENGFYNQQYCGCEFSMSHLYKPMVRKEPEA